MKGDIKYINMFENAEGDTWLTFAYSDEERDAQIEEQVGKGHTLVKTYNRNAGEIQ